jgi:hypothetical protein
MGEHHSAKTFSAWRATPLTCEEPTVQTRFYGVPSQVLYIIRRLEVSPHLPSLRPLSPQSSLIWFPGYPARGRSLFILEEREQHRQQQRSSSSEGEEAEEENSGTEDKAYQWPPTTPLQSFTLHPKMTPKKPA